MVTATEIASELNVESVVVDHSRQTYRVIGAVDVSNLQTIDGYSPVPDSDDTQ